MRIHLGYSLEFYCSQPTPLVLMLTVHSDRTGDLLAPDILRTDPWVPCSGYLDSFGNWCTRAVAPPGEFRIYSETAVQDTGEPDAVNWSAQAHPIEELPADTLMYLLPSRYCETDLLVQTAWSLFGHTTPGWPRVQAICDFVHRHLSFSYPRARATRSAFEGYREQVGVCRDFAHLAITLCRCMNIPARYCTGYLGDIGVPVSPDAMDFSAWFEAYLGGRWYTFDARHNVPRIGRVLIARGRDAADVSLSTAFGDPLLKRLQVITKQTADTGGTWLARAS